MANLYLVDKPFGENGLALAAQDAGAAVVLIQDGVYLDASAVGGSGGSVYAVERDVELRGLRGRLPRFVEAIDYAQLVDLIVEHKVVNFA